MAENNNSPEKLKNDSLEGIIPTLEIALYLPRMQSENSTKGVKKESIELRPGKRGSRRKSSGIQRPPFRQNFNPIGSEVGSFEEPSSEISSSKTLNFFSLFRFATCPELILFWLGIFLTALMGTMIPVGNIVYGEFTALLVDRSVGHPNSSRIIILPLFGGGKVIPNGTQEDYKNALKDDSTAYGISLFLITTIQMLSGIVGFTILNSVALKQMKRIKLLFFNSIIRQDISWFDTNTDMNFASKISEDLEKVRDGIGEKVGMFVFSLFSFLSGIIISFFYGWKLTLVATSSAPIIALTSIIVSRIQSKISMKEFNAYSAAGNVAEEVLGGIRTVVAFGGEQKEVERFSSKLDPATKMASRKGFVSGLGACFIHLTTYITYAIAFYYGVVLIINDRDNEYKVYTPATLIVIIFGIMVGVQNLGMSGPYVSVINSARAAATNIFEMIEQQPKINGLSRSIGIVPNTLNGDICFSDVHFYYPSRPNVEIHKGLNFTISHGKMIAIVGPSGCGKSTVLQLIQRMYDPTRGNITINGINLKDLNVRHLRSQISVVGQEPVLFSGSIIENIRYGRPDCTVQEIESAAKAADCHDFIMNLPDGYETEVGEKGAQLSGGQKQRICVARALIRYPSILLLDEATSALDARAQAKMLRNISIAATAANITVINVTHRLSAISNADYIIYMDSGRVEESGTHEDLMTKQGLYYKLISDAANSETVDDTLAEDSENVNKKSMAVNEHKNRMFEESLSLSLHSDEDVSLSTSYLMRIIRLNSKEWPYLLIGCIASMLMGSTYPAFALIFGEVFRVLSIEDKEEVLNQAFKNGLWFIAIGTITGIVCLIQVFSFGISGSRLTARLRTLTFSTMMRQEMAWFDKEDHSVGALCSRLAGECSSVQGASGDRFGILIQGNFTLILGIGLAFVFSWKMTLVSITTIPLILVGLYLEGKVIGQAALLEKNFLENATKIATEAIANIRTVISLGQEEPFMERYKAEIVKLHEILKSKIKYRGLVFAFSQSMPFYGYTLALYYGGILVANGELEYQNVITISEALVFGSWMLGQSLAFTPNFNAAKISARRLFDLFDRVPKITSSTFSKNMENWKSNGEVDFQDVSFSYPNRPDTEIIKELNLNIKAGTSLALVGHSGCGKSTCIQLLQRFYDPSSGNVTLDDEDIAEDLSLETLRSQLGIVSQEPVLFDKTIGENIAYGNNTRVVTQDEVMHAAKEANIHEFISSLPLGYDTSLGTKGAQLSGGQKQRIAIARALIRNPRVLLLDEATSALDAHSEKLVQEALENAGCGRTCIIIAHRLSSVRKVDQICVIEKGKIVESGTHEQLLLAKGIYAQMYKSQLTKI